MAGLLALGWFISSEGMAGLLALKLGWFISSEGMAGLLALKEWLA